jgi:hypothetical protein
MGMDGRLKKVVMRTNRCLKSLNVISSRLVQQNSSYSKAETGTLLIHPLYIYIWSTYRAQVRRIFFRNFYINQRKKERKIID